MTADFSDSFYSLTGDSLWLFLTNATQKQEYMYMIVTAKKLQLNTSDSNTWVEKS